MKKAVHPAYQKVLFIDSASGHRFVCGSTLKPEVRATFEGVEYPVYTLSTSSYSHPFFTGSNQFVDSEGRVEKFNKRFGRKQEGAIEASKKENKENTAPNQASQQAQGNKTPEKKPVEKKPVEKKPTDKKPMDKKPMDKKSTETKPAKPAKKRA